MANIYKKISPTLWKLQGEYALRSGKCVYLCRSTHHVITLCQCVSIVFHFLLNMCDVINEELGFVIRNESVSRVASPEGNHQNNESLGRQNEWETVNSVQHNYRLIFTHSFHSFHVNLPHFKAQRLILYTSRSLTWRREESCVFHAFLIFSSGLILWLV
jgi:hypothetical protein